MLLAASNLTFSYGARPVLRDVSLSLETGQMLVVLGPNGSGKSTLIKQLFGHLRGGGKIEWEGRALRAWARNALSRQIAYLSQHPLIEPGQTVADILRLGRSPYLGAFGLETAEDLRVVRNVAQLLQLEALLEQPVDHLSGGQRQRVFLGRCLAQEPRAMLLDEPMTFLDLQHQVELMRLLKSLCAQRKLGVVMTSHDLNLAAAFADQLMILSDGAVAASGGPEAVLREEVLERVYRLPMKAVRIDDRSVIIPRIDPQA